MRTTGTKREQKKVTLEQPDELHTQAYIMMGDPLVVARRLNAQMAQNERRRRTRGDFGGDSRAKRPIRPVRCNAVDRPGRSDKGAITLLDYGAGNIRSIKNAITKLGYTIKEVGSIADIERADRLVFPGVGAFGQAMEALRGKGYDEALRAYLAGAAEGRGSFFGICIGMQVLFEESVEDGGCGGLGFIPGVVGRFDEAAGIQVPHIGWNTMNQRRPSGLLGDVGEGDRMYFVHSYRAVPDARNEDCVLATCEYGGEFVAAVNKGNVYATQVRFSWFEGWGGVGWGGIMPC